MARRMLSTHIFLSLLHFLSSFSSPWMFPSCDFLKCKRVFLLINCHLYGGYLAYNILVVFHGEGNCSKCRSAIHTLVFCLDMEKFLKCNSEDQSGDAQLPLVAHRK